MPSLRRSFAVPPLFLRRRTDKGRSYLQATSPCPYPSLPLVEFLQLLLIVLAKLVTDGLYKIGQLALVTARFGRKIVNLAPRTLNSGRDAEIQIRSDGCPVGEKASLSGVIGGFWWPLGWFFG